MCSHGLMFLSNLQNIKYFHCNQLRLIFYFHFNFAYTPLLLVFMGTSDIRLREGWPGDRFNLDLVRYSVPAVISMYNYISCPGKMAPWASSTHCAKKPGKVISRWRVKSCIAVWICPPVCGRWWQSRDRGWNIWSKNLGFFPHILWHLF